MAFELVSIPQESNKFRFELAPAHNALSSLWLLNFEEVNYVEWISKTREQLSDSQLALNKEVCWPAATLLRGQSWESFPAWLEDLDTRDPVDLAMYDLNNLLDRISVYTSEFNKHKAEDLYQDKDLYSLVVKTIYQYTHWEFHQKEVLAEHHTLTHPELMEGRKRNILSHFTMMWEDYFSSEWNHNLGLLEDTLAAYHSIDIMGLSDIEVLTKITGSAEKPLKAWLGWLPLVKEVICFPNPHLFSYSLVIDRTRESVFTGLSTHISKSISVQPPLLSRSIIKVRLNALADDTRLQIIELLVAEPGLNAKEIKDKLGLSQSAASRHINQLTGSGFLCSKRIEGANQFTIAPDVINELHQSLKNLFGED
ncbi:MAG: helix-turn-helix domain-containing protein [Anaerolineae bacterium]|jgi:DNA-binding transcriptional ArsR family regulator|nr:helix-turn-helix domain-containing protein [Anaerolineae bacterium]